jgi:hypothetical protein
MTQEEFVELKKDYIENLEKYISKTGGLFAHISIFANKKDDSKLSIIHIPIPDDLMTNEGKDVFIDSLMPEIYKEIKKEFTPPGIGWASEAWLREANKDFDINKQDWKEIPIKKEVLFISIENESSTITQVYEIKRNGKQVTEDGDIVDRIELIEISELANSEKTEGRFSGLYKKLNKDV